MAGQPGRSKQLDAGVVEVSVGAQLWPIFQFLHTLRVQPIRICQEFEKLEQSSCFGNEIQVVLKLTGEHFYYHTYGKGQLSNLELKRCEMKCMSSTSGLNIWPLCQNTLFDQI